MKKSMIAVLAIVTAAVSFGAEAVPFKFDKKALQGHINRKVCTLTPDSGTLTLVGDLKDKNNSWRAVQIAISNKPVAGKKIKFSGEAKADLKAGKFVVAIRQYGKDGKSIGYDRVEIAKSQDWKAFDKTFTVNPKTAGMQIYFIGEKMDNASSGSVRKVMIQEL